MRIHCRQVTEHEQRTGNPERYDTRRGASFSNVLVNQAMNQVSEPSIQSD